MYVFVCGDSTMSKLCATARESILDILEILYSWKISS